MATSVPPLAFGPNGFVAPEASAVLAGVQSDIDAAFGGTLNFSLTTPQGQLASSMAAIVENTNALFVYYSNQTNPDFATGRMQDAIARIYFIERLPALPTKLQVSCSGLSGVVIPGGALVVDGEGNQYAATAAATIPQGGSVVAEFDCLVAGPVTVPGANDLGIFQAVNGWDSATVVSGVEGVNVETRAAFEARRKASVAQNSVGSLPSIRGAVLNVAGVVAAYVTENDTNSPVTVLGVTLAANSLYAAVVGGVDADVAQAIWSRKAPGCSYTAGNRSITVFDENPAYVPPFPSYVVQFERPPTLQILFAVNLVTGPLVPSNAAALVRQAVENAFVGADGGPITTIGSLVLASRFYSAIAALGVWAQIRTLVLGSANAAAAQFTGSIAGTALTVSAVASGAVAVGQTILDPSGNILPGTTIVSGSGASWVVSKSQTVASEAMTGILPALGSLQVNINQFPAVDPNNIAVTVS